MLVAFSTLRGFQNAQEPVHRPFHRLSVLDMQPHDQFPQVCLATGVVVGTVEASESTPVRDV